MGLISRRRRPTSAEQPGLSPSAVAPRSQTPFLHRDPYSLSFRPEPVVVLPKTPPSLPLKPYFWAPLGASDPTSCLGRPTFIPATSVGLVDPASSTTKTPAPPAAPSLPSTGATPPPWAFHHPASAPAAGKTVPKPVVAPSVAPAVSPTVVQPGNTAAWPTVEYAVPSGADTRWASVDYLLPRETREGLGGEHRFGERRKFSNTLRMALFDP